MKQLSFACKLLIILSLVLFTNRSASHAQFADPAISNVYLPLVSVPSPPVQIAEAGLTSMISGQYFLRGDVTAIADHPVYDVAIEARLYDDYNNLLTTATGTTVLTATLPGQLNPFNVITTYLRSDSPYVGRWEAEITGWSLDSDRTYLPATVVSIRTEVHAPYFTVVYVEVRNDNTQTVYDVRVVAWSLYQCVPIGSQSAAAVLAPGETAFFNTSLTCVDSDFIPTIKAAAQGYIVP
jgi:hypothetical protein